MGLLDTILGRTKPVRANLDALFALPSAAITLQSAGGIVATGKAGVCWKPPASQSTQDVQREISELLGIPDDDAPSPTPAPGAAGTGSAGATTSIATTETAADGTPTGPMRQAEDAYGFRWLLLEDPALDDLVARVHLVNSTLTDNGWGPQLLCSVFGFQPGPEAGADVRPFYLVYLFKRGTFYPFAPDGKEHRDSELELRVRAQLGTDLPVESDLSRWFPLWDLPVG
jgi:hypothetical protein